MNWTEFNRQYIVEANIMGTVDVAFDENTSIYPMGHTSIRTIQQARVIDRETLRTKKEYEITLNSTEVRSVSNSLREHIIQDFHIEEFANSTSTIFSQHTPVFATKKPKHLSKQIHVS